ncbi:hypothetical protein QBC37DRAFT_483945 [Rhypophila decipiens]|uniref:Protein kinase domain-containing protein n=1 Tax=Rhypophila decipiens TaxID=261697 RepID=A0AAN6Y924_9PEZI|nr:hypothetical protein QBC37DRAFT_483945 [Rhypophila decipiens]
MDLKEVVEALELELQEEYGWVPGCDVEKRLDRELDESMATCIPQGGDDLSQELDSSIKALYDQAVQSTRQTLKAMKPLDDQDLHDFCALHDISMALQHWEDDISRSHSHGKTNPLLNVEHEGANFGNVVKTLRKSFKVIINTQEQLQKNLSENSNLAKPSRRDLISNLDGQMSVLKNVITPLRILSDKNRGVGPAARIAMEVKDIRKKLQQTKPSVSIHQRSATSEFDAPQDFIPDGVVMEIINPSKRDDLVAELRAEDSPERQELVDYIIENGNLLFAISASMIPEVDNVILAMQSFQVNDIDDTYIPFLTREELRLRGSTAEKKVPLEELDMKFWEGPRSRSFRSIQWQFCVPQFSAGEICNDLHQNTILPFIKKSTEPKHGGFGEVYKVKIHERHINDPNRLLDELPEYYAVKLIKPSAANKHLLGQFWTKEASNLRDMMERKIKNVVQFITAFRRETESEREASNWDHYIVCEWADGGSVRDVWKRHPSPSLTSELVSEVTFQLLGLAEALVAAHYPDGARTLIRHGDLKPDNILCFLGGEGSIVGTLKIGDWGLARQKNFATRQQIQPSSLLVDTVRYTAPESLTGILIDGKVHKDRKSRLQDTWAMGCITLEFIMWMLYGLKYVDDFQAKVDDSNHRAYWEEDRSKGLRADEKEAGVARLVRQEMEKIANDPRCGSDPEANAIASLLHLVKTRLLVVTLPKGLGHIDMVPDDDKDDSELLSPISPHHQSSGPIRRSTMYGDDETIAGTPDTDSRSLAPSTRRSSLDVGQRSESSSNEKSQGTEAVSAVDSEHIPSDLRIIVGLHEDNEEGEEPPLLPAVPHEQDILQGQIDMTARARSVEFRERLAIITQRGEESDSYWLLDRTSVGRTPTNNPTQAGKELPKDLPPTANTDSGYGTGNSGSGSLESSKAPAITYSSSAKLVGSSRTQSNQRGSSEGQSSGGFLAPQKERNLVGTAHLSKQDYTFPVLDKDWNFHVDNSFAAAVFSAVKDQSLSGFPNITSSRESAELCQECEALRVWEPGFSIQYSTDGLRTRAPSCDLCKMFWDVCVKREASGLPTARFVKEESWLKLNGSGPPVLSLLRDPYVDGPTNLQLGLPVRPLPGSSAHFTIMRQWLEVCQNAHNHPPEPLGMLPTRLLDVGQVGDKNVLLRERKDPDFVRDQYIALSHPWGKPPHFCTFQSNIASHKKGISLDSLPPVFQDAVITTRDLGIRYLWIDSICIIQGPAGDFQEEARRMEQVFSAAVCVLAASSATGQYHGWLSRTYVDTSQNSFVSLRYSTSTTDQSSPRSIYITPIIDNFAADVLESPLNRRGWVLQERALARRTIYFTKTQTYFECGDGVRCSTMTKMTNSLAVLLGDTAFPQVMMSASKGERILRYQDFYRNYSRLGLTRDHDRPVAIAGLQSRLLKAFGTEGGFGIFDEGPFLRGHLGRSLLWVRGDDVEALEEIDFPVTLGTITLSSRAQDDNASTSRDLPGPPPSWSWMAYNGGIDYLDLEFDGIDWEGGISSPWTRPGWGIAPTKPGIFGSDGIHGAGCAVLSAMARSFDFQLEIPRTGGELADRISTVEIGGGSELGTTGRIIFDNPSLARDYLSDGVRLKCVVLGRTSWSASSRTREGAGSRTAYVIVVVPWLWKTGSLPAGATDEGKGSDEAATGRRRFFWKRIGAGYLPSRSISVAAPVRVEII